ncbi:hypothetical protein ES288_A01G053800v1 [Gossypium darwinii]|uniref:Uncharacterized protein n=2 Tax=Gossypium TaxID=3633 RepID=A0A5D2RPY7_GOSTO|nr:hypothetical protein ES288_A01G053800v1 [Gossypium darwinii]TYI41920.1 hypothetical protein ES332_A01G060500v1 [Gossypium tomentosum]
MSPENLRLYHRNTFHLLFSLLRPTLTSIKFQSTRICFENIKKIPFLGFENCEILGF